MELMSTSIDSENVAALNQALERSLAGSSEERGRAKALLGLDDANWNYFYTLYRKKKTAQTEDSPMVLFEEGKNLSEKRVAYPTPEAPPELKPHLRLVNYDQIRTRENEDAARGTVLWIKKMQAGSGSSMTRSTYLARTLGIPAGEVKIGAKGTDLFVELEGRPAPLVEALILQAVQDVRKGKFGGIVLHDIVSSETQTSVHQVWKKHCLANTSKTYDEYVRNTPGMARFRETYQSYIPTLDESGRISFNRFAPGGHALFGVDALRAAYVDTIRPDSGGRPLVGSVSNGEDISASPDPAMVGYVVREKIGIALVTTEKTPVDMKGGILALVQSPGGGISLAVFETAQAKEAGQGKRFESARGSINTNMALFNYEVLTPAFKKLVAEIGEDEFMRIIAPDLISNLKEQKDSDGVTRKYLQLEGAMGSSLMNLDRYWRKRYGVPLVHIIDVDRMKRTEFFSPIKSAFDFFMQFHSDRFEFDQESMRLKNLRPGSLPLIELQDKYYQDVENVLGCFRGARIRELDSLKITGIVRLAGCTLAGRVEIVNETGKPADLSGRTLRDQKIVV
jgi:hypothetical protein